MFREFFGDFYWILDTCADSAYQALFSAYEKERGVEAKRAHPYYYTVSRVPAVEPR